MKPSTLNTLLVAKSIYSETKYLVNTGNKHSCTAGIILLQDFVELVILAALDELDVDEQRSLESKSFDELLGELKKQKVPVIKSGTIKALNKQRVISKHYGQLAEPTSVINYFNTATNFVDVILEHVLGKKLQEIFLTDLLKEGAAKNFVKIAIELANKSIFLDALIELRKAFYAAYEYEYNIYSFKDKDEASNIGLGTLLLGFPNGKKAYPWTKNKQWIEKNVKKPTDYIQISHEQMKTDCMEWGINTVDIENFRRLTPEVVETELEKWHFEYDIIYAANELNTENFNYCLDIILDFLLKKQELESSRKWPKREKSIPAPPIYVGKAILEKPAQNSKVISHVQEGYYYSVDRVASGFNPDERYLYVHLYPQKGELDFARHIFGYMLIEEGAKE